MRRTHSALLVGGLALVGVTLLVRSARVGESGFAVVSPDGALTLRGTRPGELRGLLYGGDSEFVVVDGKRGSEVPVWHGHTAGGVGDYREPLFAMWHPDGERFLFAYESGAPTYTQLLGFRYDRARQVCDSVGLGPWIADILLKRLPGGHVHTEARSLAEHSDNDVLLALGSFRQMGADLSLAEWVEPGVYGIAFPEPANAAGTAVRYWNTGQLSGAGAKIQVGWTAGFLYVGLEVKGELAKAPIKGGIGARDGVVLSVGAPSKSSRSTATTLIAIGPDGAVSTGAALSVLQRVPAQWRGESKVLAMDHPRSETGAPPYKSTCFLLKLPWRLLPGGKPPEDEDELPFALTLSWHQDETRYRAAWYRDLLDPADQRPLGRTLILGDRPTNPY